MKRIGFPFRVSNNRLLAFAALIAAGAMVMAPNALASRRPQYGGTLRVQMSERVAAIDPRRWPAGSRAAAAAERVDSLVFDRLVRLDERGSLQPALAISWEHDAQARQWQFRLREGVKFSDGAPLTPTLAALALQQLLGFAFDVSANSDSIMVLADHSLPDLPMQLATGRFFIFRMGEDDSLSGTGPFRAGGWSASEGSVKAVFIANENCWEGRPYVDKIELTMGADPQQQANAISFGQADIAELPASQARLAAARGVRTASSDPTELFALVLDPSRPAIQDARVRQAISLAIDRGPIADVVLQRAAVSAGGVLPNWISGYAHLFPPVFDLRRAKDLLADYAREHSRPIPLVLFYDSSDAEARDIADRVAVNLREAGIMLQVTGQMAGAKTKAPAADIKLMRHRLAAPDASSALAGALNAFGEPAPSVETLQQAYGAERAAIDAFRVIPLVHLSESFGLSAQVRDWMAPRWGGWKLEDVWLGAPAAAGGNSQ